jgi:hypothetical protein
MTASAVQPLPAPPPGFRYYRSAEEIIRAPELLAYQHLLLRAFGSMPLSGVMTLNGVPTVYVHDAKRPLEPKQVAELQRDFWNQGVATVLLLRDPGRCRVVSSMMKPFDPEKATEGDINDRLVESIDMATQAAWAGNFYLSLANGSYYSRPDTTFRFDPKETIDSYLIGNLEAVRDEITSGKEGVAPETAHAFLGRILFLSYLCHRRIVKLENYVGVGVGADLREFLTNTSVEKAHDLLYRKLFPALRKRFNGSMFDDDLGMERDNIRPVHLTAVLHFLEGSPVGSGQRTLGFWAYRFDFIPVETISSIYEKFFKIEDDESKRKQGAFYTPRLLAEMTLDLALRDRTSLGGLKFIDPTCGSGIFLVIAFNRLVAEWNAGRKRKPSVNERAKALLGILGQLQGVDLNITACRIACFSLYLAYLDQFTPADVDEYIKTTDKMLPSLLKAKGFKKPDIPVIWHDDFFVVAETLRGQFDIVVGNPPWEGRGSKQIANGFMEKAPDLLAANGKAALILPSKIFLNPTSDAFQRKWLGQVTLETMVQLADFRFILFKEAQCPACVVTFSGGAPPPGHEIEYITPKVTRTDLRDGMIPVAPQDRKWIRLSELRATDRNQSNGMVWKSGLWGTPRDRKLLDYLFTLPRLDALAHRLSDGANAAGKRWVSGQGCKPWRPQPGKVPDRDLKGFGDWSGNDLFVRPKDIDSALILTESACIRLQDHFEAKGYSLRQLYSKPPEELFAPPMTLVNQGFTEAAFSDFPLRFQHSLQAFTNPHGGDRNELLFLAAFLTSKLARYFVFHTSANLGTERDKVHLDEVLRIPFFLPDDDAAPAQASAILKSISGMAERFQQDCQKSALKLEQRMKRKPADFELLSDDDENGTSAERLRAWRAEYERKSRDLRAKVEPLIYQYFGLTEQDIALVEDTCDLFGRGATPPTLESARKNPILAPIDQAAGLETYATMLCSTLNGWASGTSRAIAIGSVDPATGTALVELRQAKTANPFTAGSSPKPVMMATQRLQDASAERVGRSLVFQCNGWYFEGNRILIVKPARAGEWTRTAALNDAAELYAQISKNRQSGKA